MPAKKGSKRLAAGALSETAPTPGAPLEPRARGGRRRNAVAPLPEVEPRPVEGREASGAPGADPVWAPGAKDAIGTALSAASPVWFTLAQGIVTEVYYPRVDLANSRDMQFLLVGTDPADFFEERRDCELDVRQADPRALLWDVTTRHPQGRFTVRKRVITDPGRPSLVVRATITGPDGAHAPEGLRPFVLFAPHVADRGWENTAQVMDCNGRTVLVANRRNTYCALACSLPFASVGVGYVGASDGWTELRRDQRLSGATVARDGDVSLTAELGGDVSKPFSLALGFGTSAAEAVAHAVASADGDFAALEAAYVTPWHEYCAGLVDLSRASGDGGRLYYLSAMVIRAHEDRENPGAHTASLAIPWGEVQTDRNRAGYHLVWPRDLYHAATGRLAAGDAAGALRTLRYLEHTQREDGSWPQNFWVFGEPYWHGLQLDEIAFPILLAWQLWRADALQGWNPYPALVAPAARRIARVGPVTQQERWEENSGYSPSTLAAAIAALVCAAQFARSDRDPDTERYFLEVADYWERHLEDWTYTTCGDADGHSEYYERIAPLLSDVPGQMGHSRLPVANLAGNEGIEEAAVVDGGFLELVRYGVRQPQDPHMVQTVRVYDDLCKVETPFGPCWHRYTFDGYGQQADGTPYTGTGVGRVWPLLTGERAHYALAAGESVEALVRAMEAFTTPGGMIPEQVWDSPDIPERGMFLGRPTGSAAPLVWAHAEYVKLLRSMVDGGVFDCPVPVSERYGANRGRRRSGVVIWKHNHKIRAADADDVLRIEVYAPAALHWTRDSWRNVHHDPMQPYGHGVWVYDFPKGTFRRGHSLEFTFYWNDAVSWEGVNYVIASH